MGLPARDVVVIIIIVVFTGGLSVWRCSSPWDREYRDSRTLIITLVVFVMLLYVVTSFTVGIQWAHLGALVLVVLAIGVRLRQRADADKSLWPFLWIFTTGVLSFVAIDIMAKWFALQQRVSSLLITGVLLVVLVSIAIKEGIEELRDQEKEKGEERNKREQKDRARSKVKELDDVRVMRRADELLERIYHEVVGGADCPVRIVDLVECGDEIGDVWLRAHLLARLGDVSILDDSDPRAWTERIELTAQGYNRAAKRERPSAVISVGGDVIHAGPNAVVINRSLLSSSMNKVRSEVGTDMADALGAVAEEVSKSNNPEAVEFLDEFNRELQSDSPKKPVLKALFSSIMYAVPTIERLTDATTKIVGLFS